MPKTDSRSGLARHDSSAPTEQIIESVRTDGAAIVSGLVDDRTVALLNDELGPYLVDREPGFRQSDGDFYGSNTTRVQGLARKSPAFVRELLVHPLLLRVADHFLLPNCGDYWLSQAETIFIGPGSRAQALHRDDINWSVAARSGIDLQLSALVAVGDYDAEVGATMVIPNGSLRADGSFDPSHARPVELEPGDALLYLGSTVHGGGANTTADRWRRAIYVGYLLGWLTPEESVALSVPAELARALPDRARRLLGWSNMHGNVRSAGIESQLQLWQMDKGDAARTGGAFRDQD